MGSSTVNDIVSLFSNKILPKINKEPEYGPINEMIQLLYGNTANLPTQSIVGSHDHIILMVSPTQYTTLLVTAYMRPSDPGPNAVILGMEKVSNTQQTRD